MFYLAGFEEFQPSALETMTDIVSDYMIRLVRDFNIYAEAPKLYTTVPAPIKSAISSKQLVATPVPGGIATPLLARKVRQLKPRFTQEEALLHMLHESGHDLDNLESYVTDDIDRLSSKLETHHTRTRDYLAELLRPALDPNTAGQDGAGVFNDGSDQFVGGDFAEDIGEDFFGFKELGLDREFGIAGLSVPLHLLQSRMTAIHSQPNAAASSTAGLIMEPPAPYAPLTVETLQDQIGLVKAFFMEKLDKAGDQPLVEDDDLPPKQRFPRPRLPPTGKISSPRKRPIREQQMMARKKRRQEIEAEREREAAAANALANGGSTNRTAGGNDVPNGTAASTGVAVNNHDVTMTNGDPNIDADANGDIDEDATPAEPPSPQINRKTPVKQLGKPVKLDASQPDAKSGDPTKQPQHQPKEHAGASNRAESVDQVDGAEEDGTGNENGNGDDDKNGATNGMLSPESVVISAH